MSETTKNNADLKVGEVMYSSWGYDQTNIDYFVITRRTKCTVTLAPITSKTVEVIGWATESVMPCLDHAAEIIMAGASNEIKNKRIQFGDDDQFDAQVKLSSYQYAWLWNGKAQTATSYA
jgi:hypothetical protein|tara:strand:+ start:114 stop:473 length:360 start_codon:yes stop_codon:yes gene_type:complete